MSGQDLGEAFCGYVMGAAAGDEEEGKGESPEAFSVGGPRQPSHHVSTANASSGDSPVGDREEQGEQPSIR